MGAEADLDRLSPIGGVAGDNVCESGVPRRLRGPANELAQSLIFTPQGLDLDLFEPQQPVGELQLLDLLQQIAPGGEGLAGLADKLLGRLGKSEQGQEKASERQFDSICRVMRQIQKNQRQQYHQPQGYEMRPFKHSSFTRKLLRANASRHQPLELEETCLRNWSSCNTRPVPSATALRGSS